MGVVVDEAWADELAGEVHDLGVFTSVYRSIFAHVQDFFALDGQNTGRGSIRVAGPDYAVRVQGVCGFFLGLAGMKGQSGE